MLVLKRKVNESIEIADGLVTVTVVEIRNNFVRLAFEGPKDIEIMRTEIMKEKKCPPQS